MAMMKLTMMIIMMIMPTCSSDTFHLQTYVIPTFMTIVCCVFLQSGDLVPLCGCRAAPRQERYEDGRDNLEPVAQVSCGVAAGVVAAARRQSPCVHVSSGFLLADEVGLSLIRHGSCLTYQVTISLDTKQITANSCRSQRP